MKRKILFFSLCSILLTANLSATIRYIKVDGTGNGSSWANASSSIQTMIDNSVTGDEVWVAAGTYYPTTETITRDARSKTFLLKSGVKLLGGFAGTETLLSQRALADLNLDGKVDSCELVNATILSGDIDGVADVWSKTTNADGTWQWTISGNSGNCYNVVTANSIIDGFTVIGGNANGTTGNTMKGGGIYASSASSASSFRVTNCTVSNCSASGDGGGIYSSSFTSYTNVTNCTVSNCSASGDGGGIYYSSNFSSTKVTNCTVSNCSAGRYGGGIGAMVSSSTANVTNCIVSNCSAGSYGGGIFAHSSSNVIITNCIVSNCSTGGYGGGGIYSFSPNANVNVTNCTVSNCSAVNARGDGGGIYSISSSAAGKVTNCIVSNCFAGKSAGGVYSYFISNCALSNNKSGTTIDSGIIKSVVPTKCISPTNSETYIQPTNFIGMATNEAQRLELTKADWRLKAGSLCINAGASSTNIESKDLDGNQRVLYGSIDIGAFEFVMSNLPTVSMPITENFNNLSDWNSSILFYNPAPLYIKWNINNQKAVFNWQTNLTTSYTEQIFTYQVDATSAAKVFLHYDMYYEAYSGTVSPVGTEKLVIEYSQDLVNWSTIVTYSNANGTIANKTYKHDLSTQLAGKKFYIQFNANGENSNRIEKWEIDNVIIDTDVISALQLAQGKKYKYKINNGILEVGNLGQGAIIELFDMNGKILVRKIESQSTNFIIPGHGVYMVKVTSDLGVENKKIVW